MLELYKPFNIEQTEHLAILTPKSNFAKYRFKAAVSLFPIQFCVYKNIETTFSDKPQTERSKWAFTAKV